MASPFRCIAAINKAAGRKLSDEEAQEVLERIQQRAREYASGKRRTPEQNRDPSSPEEIIDEAARQAAEDIASEAARQERNVLLRVNAYGNRKRELDAMEGAGVGPVDGVRRLLATDPDGRTNQFSLEARALGVSHLLRSKLTQTWDALGNDFLGLVQSPEKIKLLIREMKGEDTGNALARDGARAWAKTAEEARQWFNEKGGDIGHLDDWAFPQHHSQELVARAGLERWLADVIPAIDYERYVDIAGRPMTDEAIRDLLTEAWWSIATNGANKIEPGQYRGHGARANRHRNERQIHFKDEDAVLGYWAKYGEKTLPEILFGHIETMAKDIAFLEHFGPDPNGTFRILRDAAEKRAKLDNPLEIGRIDKELTQLDNLYEYASGNMKPVANRTVSGVFDALRNLNVAGKLGSAFWASFYGDKVLFDAVARINKLPTFQNWYNEIRLLNPANVRERNLLRQQSLMLDHMRSTLHRFGEDLGRSSWTGKAANAVMRLSGMNAINDWRRGAFGLTMMDALGRHTRSKSWAEIGEQDIHLLDTFGVSEKDWNIWKLAEVEDFGHGNSQMLTPEAIARIPDEALRKAGMISDTADARVAQDVRREAVVKYLGALHSESHIAIIEPGWNERAMMMGGLQPGRVRDELMRSFWQFKSFPITQFSRILDLGLSRPTTGGKVQFLGQVVILQTIAGAMMLQTQSLLSGQDPRPMDDWRFWVAAALKGGTLGIYGDFLFSSDATTRYGSGPLEAVAGPTIGSAATAVTTAVQAGNALSEGKDTHLAAKVLRQAKGFIPAQNLWYTRAATNHIIFQNAQEALSPGYLATMRSRSVKEYGQDWWWEPGELLPDRPPDLSNAAGK